MSTFYLSDPANLEAFLWYFFEDDPQTTHRFEFQEIDGAPAFVRYDTSDGQEFVSATIHVFGDNLSWNSTGLTGGKVEYIDLWYGETQTYWGGSIWEATLSATTFDANVKTAESTGSDGSITGVAEMIGSEFDQIVGSLYQEELYLTDIYGASSIDLSGGNDTVYLGLTQTQAFYIYGSSGTDFLSLLDVDTPPGTHVLDLRYDELIDGWGVTHSFDDFEVFNGSDRGDLILLPDTDVASDTSLLVTINAKDGNDTIIGGAADKVRSIDGGAGNDSITGLFGQTVRDGAGDDVIVFDGPAGTLTPGVVYAGSGADSFDLGGVAELSYLEFDLGASSGLSVDLSLGSVEAWNETDVFWDAAAFTGSEGDDTILGGGALVVGLGGGDDYFEDGAGDETISGGDGNDTIYSLTGADLIIAGAGHDFILSTGSGTVLRAGGGSDTLSVGLVQMGASTYDGGDGPLDDVISLVDVVGGASTVNFIDETYTDPWGTVHSMSKWETVALSSFDDIVYLASGTSIDASKGGNYTIYGYDQRHSMAAGPGNDTLIGGSWTYEMSGGAGDDLLQARVSANMYGGDGNDVIEAVVDPVTGAPYLAAWGGAGDDVFSMAGQGKIYLDDLTLGAVINFDTGLITSGGDVDTMILPFDLVATDHNDTIQGFDSNWTDETVQIWAGAGDDVIYGNDVVYAFYGGDGNDEFIIDERGGLYVGQDGDDTFRVIATPQSDNVMDGNHGSDTYIFSVYDFPSLKFVHDNGSYGTDTFRFESAVSHDPSLSGWDIAQEFWKIEIIELSNDSDHFVINSHWSYPSTVIDGRDGDDLLEIGGTEMTVIGGAGDDVIQMLLPSAGIASKNDTMDGGSGADTMDGIEGGDTYIVDTPFDVVADTGSDDLIDTVLVQGADSFDFTGVDWTGVERIMSEDPLVALDGRTYAGDATLFGAGGTDTILGGKAGSEIHGGKGGDILIGDGGLADLEEYMPDLYAELPLF